MASGRLFVISGPAGAGKSEIVKTVLKKHPDVKLSVSCTTRAPRPGEVDGVGFYFYDLEGWNALKESGDLLECVEFAGNDYGTSRRLVLEQLDAGHDVLLNLPVERAAQLKKNMPEALCVYVEPSAPVLEQRCRAVARSEFELRVRLEQAEKERALSAFCDARVNSDDLDAAAEELLQRL